MAEIRKGACTGCDRTDVSITATDVLRVHAANGKRVSADNPACPGSGQAPKGVQAPEPGVQGYVCRIPAGPGGCGQQVTLTTNGRARSHLMSDMSTPCPGGSDWPLRVDPQGNRHDTAPGSEPSPAVAPEALLMEPETPGCTHPDGFQGTADDYDEDGQDTVVSVCTHCGVINPEDRIDGPDPVTPQERAALAGDGPLARHAALAIAEAEADNRAAEAQYARSVQDGLEENRAVNNHRARMDAVAAQAEVQVFDVTHDFADEATQTYGVHTGPALDCRLPGCCTHPRGFDWMDDGNGKSGEWCFLCGAPAPEPPAPEPDAWKTPADLLEAMPEGVRRTADENPECWDCGHEVTPRASRFSADSRVTHVVWECSHGFHECHPGQDPETGWCRPRLSHETTVGELEAGECFQRHTAKPPLNRLVYRAGAPAMGPLSATVVTPGPYADRTGSLTNLDEEITCTDQHGTPRPRRAPDTAVISPSSPPPPYPTPSPPARTTPAPGPARSSAPPTTPSATPPSASGTATSGKATTSGRPAPAATPTPTASKKRTPVADAFSTPKQAMKESDKYDSYGRYKLLHPDTGKPVKWTRATTFAKSVQDTFALSMWSQRMVLKGAATRADIPAAAGTLDVKADKDRMNALVEEAKKAAGDKVAANKGTAMHAYTEDLDRRWVGMETSERPVPEEFQPSVDAYEAILRAFGLEPVPGLIEFTTAVRQYEIAGTSDRVYLVTRDITFDLNGRSVTLYAGEYVVGDVKSGADLSYGWQEICIQLALYVQGLNTSGVWDWATGRWGKPEVPGKPGVQIKVRTDVGIIPHLPVDRSTTGAPLATLYAVDLDAGWAAAVLCAQVRTWRKSRKLATPLEIADVAEPEAGTVPEGPSSRTVVASRPASLEDKAKAVTSRAEASGIFQEAKAARVPVAELNRLTALMQAKLKSFVEQGA